MKQFWFLAASLGVLIGLAVLLLRSADENLAPPPILAKEVSASPQLASEPPASISKQKLSVEEFRMLGVDVIKTLPRQPSRNKTNQENVGEALPLVVAGKQLSRMADALAEEPTLIQEALPVYLHCATAQEFSLFVRALCYANYEFYARSIQAKRESHRVPREVRQLANRMRD